MIHYLAPFLYLLLGLADTVTLNLQNICSCSSLVYENDCVEASMMCTWNKKSCENVPCQSIYFQQLCLYESSRCYWSQGQCLDFTSCSQIQGTTNDECKDANMYCPASNGTNCGAIDLLNTCASINSQNACDNYFSQAGVCLWTGDVCTVATSCQQIYSSPLIGCTYAGCQLGSNNTCLPKTCSYLIGQTECLNGVIIFGPYLQNVIPCTWNSQANQCEDFTTGNTNADQCYLNTQGTYHWSSEKVNKGSCQQCFEYLLGIFTFSIISLLL